MRKSKLLSKLAVLGLAVGFAIAQPFTVRAEETETGTETENETVLEAVDMSKGVTYIYSKGDEPVVQAINLNGNSVIIKSSPYQEEVFVLLFLKQVEILLQEFFPMIFQRLQEKP